MVRRSCKGGNSFSGTTAGELGTNNNGNLNFRTNNTDKLVLDTSGNLQLQQASTFNVASAATGSQLTIQAGAATTGTNVGGTLLLQGGAGASTGASGSVVVKSNTNNSTSAFQVQNASGANLLTVDTTNTALVLGNDGTPSALTVRGGAATSSNTTGSNITVDASNGTGLGGSGDLIFRTASPTGSAVTFDQSSSTNDGAGGAAGSFTWSSSTPAVSSGHSNYLLVVGVTLTNNATASVSGVTYNGASLTKLTAINCTSTPTCRDELWYMVNPTHDGAGHNVVVTLASGTANYEVGAASYYNVDQTTPLQTAVTDSGTSGSGGAATFTAAGISTTTNQVALNVLASDQTVTNPGSQTVLWNNASVDISVGASKPGTGGTVSFSWTSNSAHWSSITTAINPVSSTSADTLSDRLHITAGGNVGIDNSSPQYALDVAGSVRNSVTSTTAFQVQNGSGVNLLTADTTKSTVTLRAGTDHLAWNSNVAPADFSSGWTTTNWTLGGGNTMATHNSGNTSALSTTGTSITPGVSYEVDFDVGGSCGTGSVSVSIGGTSIGGASASECDNQMTALVGTATNSNGLVFTPSSTWTGTISFVAIYPLTGSAVQPVLAVQNASGTPFLEVRANSDNTSTYIGLRSGQYDVGAGDNTALGSYAMQSNVNGYGNVAVGDFALQDNTDGWQNVAVGSGALYGNRTGTDDIGIGYYALQNNKTGTGNIGIGSQAMGSTTTGGYNVGVGTSVMYNVTTGGYNAGLGYTALYSITTGDHNSALGAQAGWQDLNGNFSTGAAIQNATAIGAYAQVQASNSIVLGSVDTATKVGIGITVPSNTFSVSPLDYQTGTATRTNSSATLVGTGTTWTSGVVGDIIVFADGTTNFVSAFTDATHVTMNSTYAGTTDASPVHYRFHRQGFQVTSGGSVGIGTTAPSAPLQIASDNGAAARLIIGSGSNVSNFLSVSTRGLFGYDGNNTVVQSVVGHGISLNVNNGTFGSGTVAVIDTSGNLTFQQASTVNAASAASGTQLTLAGGAATSGTNVGGNLLLQGGAGASTGASGSVLVKSNTNNSTTAFQVQDASGNQILTVDTSGGQVLLGKASSITGAEVFQNSSNANTITLQSGVTSATYALTLPTAVSGSSGSCLKDTSGAGVLGWGACGGAGGGGVTLQASTPGTADTGNFNISGTGIAATLYASTFDTASGVALNLGNSNAASINLGKTGSNIATTINGTTLLKTTSANSITAFQIQNAAGNDNLLLASTVNTNMVTNSSAETNATGWSITTGSGTPPSSTTSQALYGNASLQANTSATSTAGVKFNTGGAFLNTTTTYSLSFWAKIASGSFTVQAGRSDNNTFAGESTCTLSSSTVTTTWTRFTCSFTTGGAVTGGGYIFIRQSDSTARTWYVDGVQLEQASSATPYHEGSLQFNGTITGPTVLQNASDTTLAFQIQNAAGTSNLFVADTVNSRIGIGVASPANILDISGNNSISTVQLLSGGSTNRSSYVLGRTAGEARIGLAANAGEFSTSAAAGDAVLRVDSSSNQLILQAGAGASVLSVGSANVGIGGVTGARTLDVKGGTLTVATQSSYAFGVGNSAQGDFTIGSDGSNVYLQSWASKALQLNNQGNNVYFPGSGSVGIGTTSVGHTLTVSKTLSGGKVAGFNNFTTTDSSATGILELRGGWTSGVAANSRYIQFYDSATTDTNGVGEGSIIARAGGVTYNNVNADFGEYFDLYGPIQYGDIAAGTWVNGKYVAQQATNSSTNPIGVMSFTTGFAGNGRYLADGSLDTAGRDTIGFLGQIATHVSNINGPIHTGDPISLSTIPGYGARAVAPGQIIGHAMQDFDPTTGSATNTCPAGSPTGTACGTIQVLVNVSWYDPSTAMASNLQGNSFVNLNVTGDLSSYTLTVASVATFKANIIIEGHIVTAGDAPSAAAVLGAGTDLLGNSNATCTVNGNDTSGVLTVTTGTLNLADGAQCMVTFAKPFGATPRTVVTPVDKDSASMGAYIGATSTAMTISFSQTPQANHTYTFNYINLQ